jgi:hypothetical protein
MIDDTVHHGEAILEDEMYGIDDEVPPLTVQETETVLKTDGGRSLLASFELRMIDRSPQPTNFPLHLVVLTNTDLHIPHDFGPASMTKLLHGIETLEISHLIHQLVVIVLLDPQSEMMNVGEHGNDLIYHELIPQVLPVVLLVDEDDRHRVLNLVHEVLLLEYHYCHPRSLRNLVGDLTFSSAIEISLSERSHLEISDCVSKNFIHRYSPLKRCSLTVGLR